MLAHACMCMCMCMCSPVHNTSSIHGPMRATQCDAAVSGDGVKSQVRTAHKAHRDAPCPVRPRSQDRHAAWVHNRSVGWLLAAVHFQHTHLAPDEQCCSMPASRPGRCGNVPAAAIFACMLHKSQCTPHGSCTPPCLQRQLLMLRMVLQDDTHLIALLHMACAWFSIYHGVQHHAWCTQVHTTHVAALRWCHGAPCLAP